MLYHFTSEDMSQVKVFVTDKQLTDKWFLMLGGQNYRAQYNILKWYAASFRSVITVFSYIKTIPINHLWDAAVFVADLTRGSRSDLVQLSYLTPGTDRSSGQSGSNSADSQGWIRCILRGRGCWGGGGLLLSRHIWPRALTGAVVSPAQDLQTDPGVDPLYFTWRGRGLGWWGGGGGLGVRLG